MLGLTFKPDTDDVREAPAPEIISLLLAESAEVVGYNPIPVDVPELPHSATSIDEAVNGADAVIVATEWEEIVRADWPSLIASMKQGGVVFDGRNSLDPVEIRDAGGTYIGVGRPNA